ncbi:hypothetical protein L218DRAFT_994353 [Marasmius fiardii PR-910]|nr:hypothetical protein L218DRAFT_994353 [Marasmius fiardii PR-910]
MGGTLTPQRDPELYLEPLITFQVNDTIFKIPPKYIHEHSEVFGAGAEMSAENGEGSSDSNPVKLSPLPHGCNADDFRHLLKIIMALTMGISTPTNYTSEQWLSVLKLSTAWYFSDIRKLAMGEVSGPIAKYNRNQWITMLEFAHNSDQFADLRVLAITRITEFRFQDSRVEQVLLGRRYLHKPWIIEGLRELVNMRDLPSLMELKLLGKDTLNILLYMAFKRTSGRHSSHYDEREVEEHFSEEIVPLFPIYLTALREVL